MKDMASDEYVALEGALCPSCRAEAVDVTGLSFDEGRVSAAAACGLCGATWTEEFALRGYTDLFSKVLN